MSTESPGTAASAASMVTCRVCGTEVPDGAFCGFCGANLSPQPGNGPDWMRVRNYGAALGENVLRLSAVSTLFPHLPHRSRTAFRWGLAALVVVLVVCALLRWLAPLVAVSALGFPMLFLIYIEESDVYGDDDLPVTTMLSTVLLGALLGVGWTLWTGPIVARSYPLLRNLPAHMVWQVGFAIPVGGALLMLVPAVVVRLLRPRNLESLDGFLIGALSAVAFTAAATLVRLAPQLSRALVDHTLPVGSFLVEAGIQGVAVPVTAAAAGGVIGAALWYTFQEAPRGEKLRRFAVALVPAVLVVVALYIATGVTDIVVRHQGFQLVLHLLVATAAVLALRIGIHLALLKETREEMAGLQVVCAECHHVTLDMAFCPNCGVATRASSRTSRQVRRLPVAQADSPTEKP